MMCKKSTQEQEILMWLKDGKGLSPMEALNVFGCFRLAARIFNLRRKGWNIKTDRRNKYTIYYLEKGGE